MDTRDRYVIPPKGFRMTRFDELLFKHVPFWFLRRVLRKKGIRHTPFKIDKLLRKYQKVYIRVFKAGSRGFILEFDNQVSLWFHQRGDHFEYAGWEVGEYDDG